MFKSEPKSIVQFLATHFELLRQLYDIQVKNEIILQSQLSETLIEFSSDIEAQLFDHKFLISQNDDYIINEPYFILFEFLLQQFKPLLPEEIEKYGQSIRILFLNIKDGISKDKNILIDRIEALSSEIKKFRNAVSNNTSSLLYESKELKANTQKIEYQEKVQKARYLIDYYISPLNTILDINHSQSIYNELLAISQYSNNRRFDYTDEVLRIQFEKLYNLLRQVVKDIVLQSSILSTELLPLIERIKTESEYLMGFHLYLTDGNCYKKTPPPAMFSRSRDNVYNPFIYESTKEYFSQFKNEDEVIIQEKNIQMNPWIFDKMEYKSKLESDLPLKDFFSWCAKSIQSDLEEFKMDDFFMLTSLVFEDDYNVSIDEKGNSTTLKVSNGELIVPQLKITRKQNVPE